MTTVAFLLDTTSRFIYLPISFHITSRLKKKQWFCMTRQKKILCQLAIKPFQCLALPYPAFLICYCSLIWTILLQYLTFPVISQPLSPRPLIMLISLSKLVHFCISKSNQPLQLNVPFFFLICNSYWFCPSLNSYNPR